MNEPMNAPNQDANPALHHLEPPRLAPSSLGEILDRTVHLYRSRFLVYLGISLVPTALIIVPACGFFLLLAGLGSLGAGSAAPAAAGVLGIVILCGVGLLALPVLIGATALSSAAMNHAVSLAYLGERTTIRAAYKAVWRQGWRYSWLLVLEGLIIWAAPMAIWIGLIALSATGLALGLVAGMSSLAGGALIGILIFLTVVAVIAYLAWMLLRICLAFPACVIEKIGAWDAIKRSATLSKGTKGRIFLLYVLGFVLNSILSMGITVPLIIVMSMLPGANDPKHATTIGVVMLIVVYGAGFAIQAVTRPIYGIALTLFYYDQRIRQEGFDIEWMMLRAGMVLAAPIQIAPLQPLEIQTPSQAPPPAEGESI